MQSDQEVYYGLQSTTFMLPSKGLSI